jgi:hypothetical protein
MLRFLGDGRSLRKHQLFAAACCRRVEHLLIDRRSVASITVAESFADGLIDEEARYQANADAYRAWEELPVDCGPELEPGDPGFFRSNLGLAQFRAADAAHHASLRGGGAADLRAREAMFEVDATQGRPLWQAEKDAQRDLLRDIFGNPFRPVAFDPAWRTSTAVALARQMYESRDFALMPILADALQDAGCENEDVLAHCRGTGPHVRGCWVVDLVLGKS